MNYRKFYEEQTKTKLPKNFDVHHIDHDRTNNNIDNLIAILRELHQHYHQLIKVMNVIKDLRIDVRYNPITFNYILDDVNELAKTTEEIHKFIYYRDYLLGKIPYSIFGYKY